MSRENQNTDQKSLRAITGKTAAWEEIAKDCVCFANSQGGRLLIDNEDSDHLPPASQTIPADFWFGRLLKLGLLQGSGQTQAKLYFLNPDLLRDSGIDLSTTLTRIEPHRLEALIIEDLNRYPCSAISEIHSRIAPELPQRRVKTTLDNLISQEKINKSGVKRWTRYQLNKG